MSTKLQLSTFSEYYKNLMLEIINLKNNLKFRFLQFEIKSSYYFDVFMISVLPSPIVSYVVLR